MARLYLVGIALLLLAPTCGDPKEVAVLFPSNGCETGKIQPQVYNRGNWDVLVESIDADTCFMVKRLWTMVVRGCCVSEDGTVDERYCTQHGAVLDPEAVCP